MLLHTCLCFTFLLQIRTEWVEIPQQPYKPARTGVKHHPPAATKANESTTKRIQVIYTDNPVSHQWGTTIEQEATTKRNRIYVNNFSNQHPNTVTDRPTTAAVQVEANIKRNRNNMKLNVDIVTQKATVETVSLETSTKGNRVYKNVSLNQKWIKGNVFRAPTTVAKVEHVRKPDMKVEQNKRATKDTESVEENYIRNVNRRIDHFNTRYSIEETSVVEEMTIASTPKNYRLTKAPIHTNENIGLAHNKNSPHRGTNISLKPHEHHTNNRIEENSRTRTPETKVTNVTEQTKHIKTTEALKDKFQTNRPNRRIYIQDIINQNKHENHDAEPLPVFKPKVDKPNETKNKNRVGNNNVSVNKYSTRIQDANHQNHDGETLSVFKPKVDKPIEITNKNRVSNNNVSIDKYSIRILDADFETEVVNPSIPRPSKDKTVPSSRFKPKDKRTYIVRIDKPYLETPQEDLSHVSQRPPTTTLKDVEDHSEAVPVQRIDISSLTLPKNPEFVTKQEYIDDDDDAKTWYKDYEETVNNVNPNTQHSVSATTKAPELMTEGTKYQNEDDTKEEISGETNLKEDIPSNVESEDLTTSSKKPNPIENVVKFMKVVSETISKSAHKSIESKTRYLQRLRDTIMMNIEERIDATWPNDEGAGAGRRATRAARGHVEFPSSEGALMTISFLTFAVFLIKLVLQVINTYKNKTMMVSPAVFAVSRAALAGRSQTHN